jgi:hypothetical protein
MEKPPQVVTTETGINSRICEYFAKGCGGEIVSCENAGSVIATFGILRGTGEVIKRAKEFWYLDHAYFGRAKLAKWGRGYFRIVHNAFWHNGKGRHPSDRLKKIVPHMNDWRTAGSHIVVVPPSSNMSAFLGLENWLQETTAKIKKHSDRRIVVARRPAEWGLEADNPLNATQNPLNVLLENSWALVTDHSNAAMEAMIKGIPAIMTNPQRKFSSIEDIENPLLDRSILNTLAYQQWKIEDIQSGQAWRELTEGFG